MPSVDVIGRLRQTLREDSRASAAVPRISLEPLGDVVIVGDHLDGCDPILVDREQVGALPPYYHVVESLYPCFCIKQDLFGNVAPYDEFDTFPAIVLTYLSAARRRGFLVVIDNRALLPVSNYEFDRNSILTEADKVMQRIQEYALVQRRLTQHPAVAEERRMRVAVTSCETDRRTLILDCSDFGAILNGTLECAFGILKGISHIDRGGWDVTAMFSEETQKVFDLRSMFPGIRIVNSSDSRLYDVALRLAQAWSIRTIKDLSERGRSVAVLILDVIGPDILYATPDGSEEAFQFVGEHADGIVYISEYSRQQFRRRYYVSSDVLESVISPTLDPADYASVERHHPSDDKWILIFGNAYEHKDLRRTIDVLATAFPFQKFKVVGADGQQLSNVDGFRSGGLEKRIIDELFQFAKCVVFPSFYEGFGFPILSGLSHDKTVIARRSPLLREIAALFPNTGQLIEFDNSLELVPIVATLLEGGNWPTIPLGSEAKKGYGWPSCGACVLDFVNQLRATEKPLRWRQRDRALQYVFAPR